MASIRSGGFRAWSTLVWISMLHGCVITCALALSAPAWAQGAPALPLDTATDEERPWAAGVSADEQARALALYETGNLAFAESRFVAALAQYKEAIRHWDHPAIHYNMAICLISLDQPIEARSHLERSLQYQARALGNDAYEHGLIYRKLLDGQLARVTIESQIAAAEVTLDGKRVLDGVGRADQFVMPGVHQVVVSQPGRLTVSEELRLTAGTRRRYEVPLAPSAIAAPILIRRWPAWQPWAVIAGGVAVAGIGAWRYRAASDRFAAYDREIANRCAGATGCDAAMFAALGDAHHLRASADRDQVIAFSAFALGGAAIVAGVVGLVINQLHVQTETEHVPAAVAVTRGGASVALRWGF